MMSAAAILRPFEPKRSLKKAGTVMAPSLVVMRRVRLASTTQASRLPTRAFPTAIQSELRPKPKPILPAYPTKSTALK